MSQPSPPPPPPRRRRCADACSCHISKERWEWLEDWLLEGAVRVLACFDVFARFLGPLLLVVAAGLISLMTWTYFDVIAPRLGLEPTSPLFWALTVPGLWIVLNLVGNYACGVLVPPGSPADALGPEALARARQRRRERMGRGGPGPTDDGGTDEEEEDRDFSTKRVPIGPAGYFDEEEEEADTRRGLHAPPGGPGHSVTASAAASAAGRGGAGFGAGAEGIVPQLPLPPVFVRGWCVKCDAPKPLRTHHCSVCRRCVLKMDHHCPWLHNCVGWGNYPFFVRTLFYVWAGCLFIAATSSQPFVASLHASRARQTPGPPAGLLEPETRLQLSFAMAVAVGIAISGLLGWHVYLVRTAQTSIEWYGNASEAKKQRLRGRIFHNPFDLGWRRNAEEVFGTPSGWRWALPALRAPYPLSQGIGFPTRSQPFRRGVPAMISGGCCGGGNGAAPTSPPPRCGWCRSGGRRRLSGSPSPELRSTPDLVTLSEAGAAANYGGSAGAAHLAPFYYTGGGPGEAGASEAAPLMPDGSGPRERHAPWTRYSARPLVADRLCENGVDGGDASGGQEDGEDERQLPQRPRPLPGSGRGLGSVVGAGPLVLSATGGAATGGGHAVPLRQQARGGGSMLI